MLVEDHSNTKYPYISLITGSDKVSYNIPAALCYIVKVLLQSNRNWGTLDICLLNINWYIFYLYSLDNQICSSRLNLNGSISYKYIRRNEIPRFAGFIKTCIWYIKHTEKWTLGWRRLARSWWISDIYHITYLRQEMVVSLCTAHDQIISAILLQMNISFIMMNTWVKPAMMCCLLFFNYLLIQTNDLLSHPE